MGFYPIHAQKRFSPNNGDGYSEKMEYVGIMRVFFWFPVVKKVYSKIS